MKSTHLSLSLLRYQSGLELEPEVPMFYANATGNSMLLYHDILHHQAIGTEHLLYMAST